jgi:hypothetical protein
MLKKMMLLAMAVGALVAFAVPATASATLLLQAGKSLKQGTLVEATSTDVVESDTGGESYCKVVTIKSEVTQSTKAFRSSRP